MVKGRRATRRVARKDHRPSSPSSRHRRKSSPREAVAKIKVGHPQAQGPVTEDEGAGPDHVRGEGGVEIVTRGQVTVLHPPVSLVRVNSQESRLKTKKHARRRANLLTQLSPSRFPEVTGGSSWQADFTASPRRPPVQDSAHNNKDIRIMARCRSPAQAMCTRYCVRPAPRARGYARDPSAHQDCRPETR